MAITVPIAWVVEKVKLMSDAAIMLTTNEKGTHMGINGKAIDMRGVDALDVAED